MGRLEDRLLDHPVRERIEALRGKLEIVPKGIRAKAEGAGVGGVLERGVALCDYLVGLLDSADPRFVAGSTLDSLRNALTKAASRQISLWAMRPSLQACPW